MKILESKMSLSHLIVDNNNQTRYQDAGWYIPLTQYFPMTVQLLTTDVAPTESKEHHHSLKDKILHPGKHRETKVDPKDQTSAGAMKTEEQLATEKEAEQKKKESFGHKFSEYVKKESVVPSTNGLLL